MEELKKAIERGATAGKLRRTAKDYERKAAALTRAAARYSAGACEALAAALRNG